MNSKQRWLLFALLNLGVFIISSILIVISIIPKNLIFIPLISIFLYIFAMLIAVVKEDK